MDVRELLFDGRGMAQAVLPIFPSVQMHIGLFHAACSQSRRTPRTLSLNSVHKPAGKDSRE